MKIHELTIYTPNLKNQVQFYTETLGLTLLNEEEETATIAIGYSKLTFVERQDFTPYHFAINIPSYQEEEALKWLKERVTILKDNTYEIQDFDFWNAMAIYFYDADDNIVEFIARKNLDIQTERAFDQQNLIGISEIGVPVEDIEPTFNTLNQLTGIEVFDGGFERFCAIGCEKGLFICINKKAKDWFPTDDKAYSSEFKVAIEEQGKRYLIGFINEEILLV